MNKNTSEHENNRRQSVLVLVEWHITSSISTWIQSNDDFNDDNQNINEYIDSLSQLDTQKHNHIINKLYNLIKAVDPYLVAKITGMIYITINKNYNEIIIK